MLQRVSDQEVQLEDLFSKRRRIQRGDYRFQLLGDLLPFVLRQFVEVFGELLFDLSPPVGLGVLEDLLALLLHALQAAPHGVDT